MKKVLILVTLAVFTVIFSACPNWHHTHGTENAVETDSVDSVEVVDTVASDSVQ